MKTNLSKLRLDFRVFEPPDWREWDFSKKQVPDSVVKACCAYEYVREALRQPYVFELLKGLSKSAENQQRQIRNELRRVLHKMPYSYFATFNEPMKPWIELQQEIASAGKRADGTKMPFVELKKALLDTVSKSIAPPKWDSFRAQLAPADRYQQWLEGSIEGSFELFSAIDQKDTCAKWTKGECAYGYFAFDPYSDKKEIVTAFTKWLEKNGFPKKKPTRGGAKKARKQLRELAALRLRNHLGRKTWDKLDPPDGHELPYRHQGHAGTAAKDAQKRLESLIGRDDPAEREAWEQEQRERRERMSKTLREIGWKMPPARPRRVTR